MEVCKERGSEGSRPHKEDECHGKSVLWQLVLIIIAY